MFLQKKTAIKGCLKKTTRFSHHIISGYGINKKLAKLILLTIELI